MKIVFMGTPQIAVDSLQRLIDDGHEVAAVVTQPDKPKGRGKKMAMSPVKELALKHNICVLQPEKASKPEFIDEIREINPDLVVVLAYGQILKKDLLEIPKLGCINVHVSLLPELRGAAPINWAIINGLKKTGITTMFMDAGLDTGDIIEAREFELNDEITAGELHDWMMVEGAEILSSTIKKISKSDFSRTKQDNSKSTYAPTLNKEMAHVDFSRSARGIHNLVRGINPWPGAWCEYGENKMKIWKTCVLSDAGQNNEIGKIADVDKNGIVVLCGIGKLLIQEIQMPNKKRMAVSEYIKGNDIELGLILK